MTSIFGSDGTDPEEASGLLQPLDTLDYQGGVADVLDTGYDAGIDGAGASAEEAAMHVVGDGDDSDRK